MTELRVCSALQKIFSDAPALPAERKTLRLFSGERGSVQLCLRAAEDASLSVALDTALPCRLYEVKEVPVGLPVYPDAGRCTVLRDTPGDYPDLLVPFCGALPVKAGRSYALWAEVDTRGVPAGAYPLRFTVAEAQARRTVCAEVLIGETPLPEQTLIHTDWFHSDCLSTYYDAPVFGERWWRIVENYMRNAAEHGVNCILTPLFTPPLDTEVGSERPTVQLTGVKRTAAGAWAFDFTRLTRWMDLAERCGIRYFEFSHLFTQWGALAAPKVIADTPGGEQRIFGWETDSLSEDYRGFLRALGGALTAFTDARGCTDRCFVHCSDEPGAEHLERYEKCAGLVHTAFGAYRHIDALSDFAYYETGLVPVPVPSENSIAPFVGRVPSLWTYYCCGQFRDEMPNRFIAFPSIRNRILGALLYRYGCDGFLHWGYNFWYTQLSRARIDPFAVTDAGKAFPAGDAFCVYPGENGEPLSSLRQKVFADGLQDLRALRAAEKKLGAAAVRALVADTLGGIGFSRYPMDEETFFRFRDALWAAVNGPAAG